MLQAEKFKDFLDVVSTSTHDLNNTVAALRGFAEILQDDLPANTQEKLFAQKILQAALQAQNEIAALQAQLRQLKE